MDTVSRKRKFHWDSGFPEYSRSKSKLSKEVKVFVEGSSAKGLESDTNNAYPLSPQSMSSPEISSYSCDISGTSKTRQALLDRERELDFEILEWTLCRYALLQSLSTKNSIVEAKG